MTNQQDNARRYPAHTRLTAEEKDLLERAAEKDGSRGYTTWMREVALTKARRILGVKR